MDPKQKSSWLAQASLWVIAISLLTIAACLVLLVMRTVFNIQPDAPASVAETPAIQDHQPSRETAKRGAMKPEARHITSQGSSARSIEVRSRAEETLAVTDDPAPARIITAALPMRANPNPVIAYSASPAYRTAISGTVRLQGIPPPETLVDIENSPCATPGAGFEMTTRFFLTDTNGGLADTLVFIADGLPPRSYSFSLERQELVFTNCQIEPYVCAVLQNQQVVARDTTGATHSMQLTPGSGPAPSLSFVNAGATASVKMPKPELFIKVSCQVHPWEFAYISSLKHPFFAVTDEHGEFTITNVPPGNYLLKAMHRSGKSRPYGENQSNIKVRSDEVTSQDFVIHAP